MIGSTLFPVSQPMPATVRDGRPLHDRAAFIRLVRLPPSARLLRVIGLVPALAALVLALAPHRVAADTIRVPGDFSTLNEAVAEASAGDVILVGPDTYDTEVQIGVPLTIQSTAGAAVTILTGSDQHRIFDNVTANLVLEGFTLEQAGNGQVVIPASVWGGALVVQAGVTATVENCVFRNNKAGRGAGIESFGALTVRNCAFENNSNGLAVPSMVETFGAGIMVDFGSTALIEDCTFLDNRAYHGGAVHARGDLTVRRCTFEEGWGNAGGGAIFAPGSAGTILIEDCVFRANRGGAGGGAITLSPSGPQTIRRCEFTENTAGQDGGGLAVSGPGPILVEDCRFIDNDVTGGGGGGGMFAHFVAGGITIQRCFFRGNESKAVIFDEAGGGALRLSENAQQMGADILDCTFVENSTANGRGAAVLVVGNGSTNQFPRFLRCIFAFNVGGPIFACGTPGENFGNLSVDCSLLYLNEVNAMNCGASSDIIIVSHPQETPIFCDQNLDRLCSNSPWATMPACAGGEPLGGLDDCGPCGVPTVHTSWGAIKNIYRVPGARSSN